MLLNQRLEVSRKTIIVSHSTRNLLIKHKHQQKMISTLNSSSTNTMQQQKVGGDLIERGACHTTTGDALHCRGSSELSHGGMPQQRAGWEATAHSLVCRQAAVEVNAPESS